MNADSLALPGHEVAQIGIVESPFRDPSSRFDYASTESTIVLAASLEEGLAGIEYFSHLWVVYRQHRSEEWLAWRGWKGSTLVLPPDDDRAGQGVFSSRAPCRPARLGSCVAELKRREGNRLVVTGLDALDGTPVLDLKVYVPKFDAFSAAVVPTRWARVMNGENDLADNSRAAHWDTTGADFALGLRAGARLLGETKSPRSHDRTGEVEGSLFFAQGFEAATGCSPLRGTLRWTERTVSETPWSATLHGESGRLRLDIRGIGFADAAAVMAAGDKDLAWSLLHAT